MSLLDKRIIIVTGKGGTGKTTVSAALGLWAARSGKRTFMAMMLLLVPRFTGAVLPLDSLVRRNTSTHVISHKYSITSTLRDNLDSVLFHYRDGQRLLEAFWERA